MAGGLRGDAAEAFLAAARAVEAAWAQLDAGRIGFDAWNQVRQERHAVNSFMNSASPLVLSCRRLAEILAPDSLTKVAGPAQKPPPGVTETRIALLRAESLGRLGADCDEELISKWSDRDRARAFNWANSLGPGGEPAPGVDKPEFLP